MPKDSWMIRKVSLQDLDAFRQIRLEALQRAPHSFASTYDEWSAFEDVEWRKRMDIAIFVAFAQGVPVGLMGLKRSQPAKMRHRATLVMVYVRQSLRGSGLASALLQAVEAYARTEDISQIELVLREDNEPARRFYRKRGFAEVGFIPDGFREYDNRFHEILMTRSLEQPQ